MAWLPESSRAKAFTLVILLFSHNINLHQTAFKIVLGSLIWPQPFCHLPCWSLTCPHQAILWRLQSDRQARLLSCQHTDSQRAAASSRCHSVRGQPPTLTEVEGNATFGRPSPLSDNSAFSLKDSTGKLQTFKTNLVFIQLCNHFYVLSVFHTPWNGATLCNWISSTVTQRH